MARITRQILRWAARLLLSFMLIAGLLLLGQWLLAQWRTFEAATTERDALARTGEQISGEARGLLDTTASRMATLRAAPLHALSQRHDAVERQIADLQAQRLGLGGLADILAGQPILEGQRRKLQFDVQLAILEQERRHLQALRAHAIALQSRQAQAVELERLRLDHVRIFAELQRVRQQRAATPQLPAWRCNRLYGSPECLSQRALAAQEQQTYTRNQQAWEAYTRQRALVRSPGAAPVFEAQRDAVDALLRPLQDRRAGLEAELASHWLARAVDPVRSVAWTAAGILLGGMLAFPTIKAFFYFVLAPLAARRPPLHLVTEDSGALALASGASAVSRTVWVDADHELLLLPEFLQSSSNRGHTRTRWLLDHRHPFTSLAANLYGLVCVRTDAPEAFVVSATQDALSEIGVLVLPQGAAVVLQPRKLVGVLQQRDAPLHITAHWRLGSLHAWLTLQLRYLVFHGPAQLVVQGCRGVRIAPADAGRSISQAATIGFSAGQAYTTRRSETFLAYLRGKQSLLLDSFGGPGHHVYEETPSGGRRAGAVGRGLEGLGDALLKVCGR